MPENTPPSHRPAHDWTRRYCRFCRERLPLASFDTSRDNPAIGLWHFVCRQCESAPPTAIEPVAPEGDSKSGRSADFESEKLLIYDRSGKTIRVLGRQIGESDGYVVIDGIVAIE